MIWVTSFTKELYEVSGEKLLESFVRTNTDGIMFVGHEGFKGSDIVLLPRNDNIFLYDLDEDLYLHDWLQSNKDVIPEEWGGETKPCDCKDAGRPPSNNHVKGCHWSWFNRNCCRWFRKVVTLNAAIVQFPKSKDMIWIDCDCIFKGQVETKNIRSLYERHDGFFLKGPRLVPECGIVGYNMQRKGKRVFEKMRGYYDSGQFKAWNRWDDSFVYYQATRTFDCRDIVGRVSKNDGHVVQYSLLKHYITHNKGEHGRVREMFN